jgi:hypothetical protein
LATPSARAYNVVLVCRSAWTYNGRSGNPGKVASALVDGFPALQIPDQRFDIT